MSAAVLFIPDQSEILHIEQADYRKFRKLSQPQTRPQLDNGVTLKLGSSTCQMLGVQGVLFLA